MTEQVSLWKNEQQSSDLAELTNALYERELQALAHLEDTSIAVVQGRLKSLPYYIKRAAHLMIEADTPLDLDLQNASWSAKQSARMPISEQDLTAVNQWYSKATLQHGLVVPILQNTYIALDCIDRIDLQQQRFRTNVYGWFSFSEQSEQVTNKDYQLLKPNKRIMTAACSGHSWVNNHKSIPVMPTLRELLLSCTINWQNFKKPISSN